MSFTATFKSLNPADITSDIFKLLDEETEKEALEFDRAFQQLKTKQEKLGMLAEFETSTTAKPKRDPKLLEKWTHYRWLRLELLNLANQRAALNTISNFQEASKKDISKVVANNTKPNSLTAQEAMGLTFKQFQAKLTEPSAWNSSGTVQAVIGSVHQAIQEDFLRGLSITQSIEQLEKILLQVVGTEHPTDPLSQQARDNLTKLANEMESSDSSAKEANIRDLLRRLQKEDPIPPSRRDPEEEVNRDIRITLDTLYDSLPHLITSIFAAYKNVYGEALTNQHREEILAALKNLVRHCSWAGFDADGNENITPEAMRYAIRLHRIRAAEKHTATLNYTDEICKDLERNIRDDINSLNSDLFDILNIALKDRAIAAIDKIKNNPGDTIDKKLLNSELSLLTVLIEENTKLLKQFDQFKGNSSHCLINRNFVGLIANYAELEKFLKNLPIAPDKLQEILKKFEQQREKAIKLDKLTRFSGAYKNESKDEKLSKGALQKFQEILKDYKEKVRDNTDGFKIRNEKGELEDPTQYAIAQLQKLMHEHREILTQFPQLKNEIDIFNIQLHGFGLTYGFGHIRQDSSVYVKLWNAILEDFRNDAKFQKFEIFTLFPEKTTYSSLKPELRNAVQKKLLDGSEESKKLLAEIYRRHHKKIYTLDKKYKDNPSFGVVTRELERLELGLRHQDMVENIIISNCENSANLLEVAALLQVLPHERNNILIVPLLEKKEDLKKYEIILIDFIKLKIQNRFIENFTKIKDTLKVSSIAELKQCLDKQDRNSFAELLQQEPALKVYLKDIIIEAMVGFSDTERVSGLGALISVQQVQEDFIKLVTAFGLIPKIYHGPGGDPNRGGLKRRDPKATLQGNARSVLNTAQSALRFSETKFYETHKHVADPAARMEFASKAKHIQGGITECEKAATEFYEFLHNTENGLGKLLGFMLGQGAHWMVNILNSSSRATQRGIPEDHGDRTASIQTGGSRPESYIDPDKPRAITATQIKETLADNINLIMGPGFGLRQLGLERAESLYDFSVTIRDMVEKTNLGIAMADLRVTKEALFASNPKYLPKDDQERAEWAKECKEKYPNLLKKINKMEDELKDEAKRNQLVEMMSRLFAYIEQEFLETREFLFKLNQKVHYEAYRKPNAPKKITISKDLLFHYSDWQAQAQNASIEAEGLFLLMARQNYHVAQGKNLDEVYGGLNDIKNPDSNMTRVGRLVGNVGAGITAFRIMPPGFYEGIYLDYSEDLRLGVARAEQETQGLNRGKVFGKPLKSGFFVKTEKKPQAIMAEVAEEIAKTILVKQ